MNRRSNACSRLIAPRRGRAALGPRVEPLHPRVFMDAAPSVSLNPAPLAYYEKQGPANIDPALTVSAGANAQLEAATVRLIDYRSGEDVLAVAAPNGLAAWWDPTRGVLALTGAAPASSYQAALRSVTYADLSADPSTSTRVAEILITDGQSISRAADRGISIVATNDPPGILAPPAQNILAGATLTFGAAGGDAIVVSDADANGAAEQVTLAAVQGRLALTEAQGLNFTAGTGAGDSTVTFTGTLDRINAALDGLTFAPDADYTGSASVVVSVDDLGNTGRGGPQVVNARVPITVTGNPRSNTPGDTGARAGDHGTTPPAPPTVGQSPPGEASLLPVSEPATEKGPLPVTLAAPPEAASTIPSDMPVPPTLGASESNGTDAAEESGGAIAAASGAGTSDAGAAQQKTLPVLCAPPPPRASGSPASIATNGPAKRVWARQLTPASARIEPLLSANRSDAESEATGGFFAFAPPETLRTARRRPHLFFGDSGADPDRDDAPMARNAGLWRELDALHRPVTSDVPLRVWAGTASVLSVGASVAWFLWMSRAGSLLSGLASALPAWTVVDPLPILDHLGQTGAVLKRNADDGIEKLLTRGGGN